MKKFQEKRKKKKEWRSVAKTGGVKSRAKRERHEGNFPEKGKT